MPEPVEFPIPFNEFARSLVGTEDEVWSTLLRLRHGDRKGTIAEWRKRLAALKSSKG